MTAGCADAVKTWLNRFAACVRARDFDAGKSLFDADVFSFGTVAEFADGLDALSSRQWAPVWLTTRGFCFADEPLRIVCSQDGRMAVVYSLWTSESESCEPQEIRSGRATIVLCRESIAADWKAIHTHLSLAPRGPT